MKIDYGLIAGIVIAGVLLLVIRERYFRSVK